MLSVMCNEKTAYEMHISDWSSDVFTSDLIIWSENHGEYWLHQQNRRRWLGQQDRYAGLFGYHRFAPLHERQSQSAEVRRYGADHHPHLGEDRRAVRAVYPVQR